MIRVQQGPLIAQPDIWTLVFDRKASSRLKSWAALGTYKHVRAYGYVPYLHVWVFYDPRWSGTDIIIAADGEPAQRMLGAWLRSGDGRQVRMRCQAVTRRSPPPLLGWCVPAIKRLIGLRGGALRPDALLRSCLRNGGEPLEAGNGRSEQGTPAHR